MTEYNGHVYYLIEEGLLQGAVYTGTLQVGDTIYSFNSTSGELEGTMNASQQTVPIILP